MRIIGDEKENVKKYGGNKINEGGLGLRIWLFL